MSKLPLCCSCKQPLVGTAYLLIRYTGLPGKPSFGWHLEGPFDCIMDPLRADLENRRGDAAIPCELILKSVLERGRKCISAGAAFWKSYPEDRK